MSNRRHEKTMQLERDGASSIKNLKTVVGILVAVALLLLAVPFRMSEAAVFSGLAFILSAAAAIVVAATVSSLKEHLLTLYGWDDDLAERSSDVKHLLWHLMEQDQIDDVLVSAANACADASDAQVDAQGAWAKDDENEELKQEMEKAKSEFHARSSHFYNLCRWVDSAGYHVRQTPEQKFSFKLYKTTKPKVAKPSTPPAEVEDDDIPF